MPVKITRNRNVTAVPLADKPVTKTVKKVVKNSAALGDLARGASSSRYDDGTPGPDVGAIFKSIKSSAKYDFADWQHGVAFGEMDIPPIDVPLPSLCLEMFTGASVLPVSSCYALAGPTSSYKSHLSMEIARWVAQAGGAVDLAENESRFIPDIAHAVMGVRASQVYVHKCTSFNEVEKALTGGLAAMLKTPEIPFLQIVDSIVGSGTEEGQKKLAAEGEVERSYPRAALAAANFLPDHIPKLGHTPFMNLWITHSREEAGANPYAGKTIKMKGGDRWVYSCNLALYLTRTSAKPKFEDDAWIVKCKLQLLKDSAIITVSLPFTVSSTSTSVYDDAIDEERKVRHTKFNWDEASLTLMEDPAMWGYPDNFSEKFADILGFEKVKIGSRNGWIATKLGIDKSIATSEPTVIMDALYHEDNRKIFASLRAALGITKGIELSHTFTYSQAYEIGKATAKRRAESVVASSNVRIFEKGGS